MNLPFKGQIHSRGTPLAQTHFGRYGFVMPYLSRLLELGTRFYRRNHFVECFLFLFSIFVMYLLIPEESHWIK